jgi:hypothetical protein
LTVYSFCRELLRRRAGIADRRLSPRATPFIFE